MNWLKNLWKALTAPPANAGPGSFSPPVNPAPVSRTPPDAEYVLGNFTPRAQQVLSLSRKEADRFNHNFVGTEHLLLGLISLGQGTAVTVLKKMGLNLEIVRGEVENQVGTGPDQKMHGAIPYTPRVKKVLALAANEAKALNHTYVGTEHILLGMIREADGVAARVLNNLGVDLDATRDEILRELDPNFDSACAAGPSSSSTVSAPSAKTRSQNPGRANLQSEPVNISRRFDFYCSERDQGIVVYRNALFIGPKTLVPGDKSGLASEFIEIEQADGKRIFLSRISIIKFCDHGTTPGSEPVS